MSERRGLVSVKSIHKVNVASNNDPGMSGRNQIVLRRYQSVDCFGLAWNRESDRLTILTGDSGTLLLF